jgi:hypothetical protein
MPLFFYVRYANQGIIPYPGRGILRVWKKSNGNDHCNLTGMGSNYRNNRKGGGTRTGRCWNGYIAG